MPEMTENVAIKSFLESRLITQDEILFCSKNDWFTIDTQNNQDWSESEVKQNEFWESIEKLKLLFESTPQDFKIPSIYDFSFIHFPAVQIVKTCIVSPKELLSELSDSCLFAIFYKAIFYGEVQIVGSEFKIDLDFRESVFNHNFSLISCKTKGIDFSNATFKKHTNIRKSNLEGGVKFNKSTFHDNFTLEEIHFQDHVNLTINSVKKCIFNDLKFEKIASFGGAVFADSVSINSCIFQGFTDFTKTGFKKQVFFINVYFHDVNFIDTIFLSNVGFIFLKADSFIMRNPIIKHIKINNSFIKDSDIDRFFSIANTQNKDQPSPLTKKNISDRQTARILKNLYDNQKNIPESNRLFSIEQDYFIDEIKNKNILESNKLSTLITLYLNKYISYFGTDWMRPLLVMFIFSFLATFFYIVCSTPDDLLKAKIFLDTNNTKDKTDLLLWNISGFAIGLVLYSSYHYKKIRLFALAFIGYILILCFSSEARDISNDISKLINPL
ncbi:MAG: hypothetical protein B7Y13_06925, partial [Sulfurovum sp. 24-42-9]